MPLSETQVKELQAEYFAEDVPYDLKEMGAWSEDDVRTYFDSGGMTKPISADPHSLYSLPASKLINGQSLTMSSLKGAPVFVMNVASR